ncbi:MAG: hypothetical protein GY786_19615 [Proteobacteria bacterium]|nr:hypothetical protein [Pseudomonadota bacterium]
MSKQSLLFFLLLFSFWKALSAQVYVVGEADVLRIEVYDNSTLNTTVTVSAEGDIVIPLLGKVKVGGLSTTQITEKLTSLLADGYLLNPQVNISINQYGAQKVTILGQVNTPGIIDLDGPTTLLELISRAGGLTGDAGGIATIKRGLANNKNSILTIDLNALIEKGDIAQNIKIVGGDNVSINRSGFYYVSGEVTNPSSYRYNSSDLPNVIKAITQAGGFTVNANQDAIKIFRVHEGKDIVLEAVKLNQVVLKDDVILIPNIFTENFKGHKATILGKINNPGNYELRGDITLLEFISKAGGLSPEAGNLVTIKRKGIQQKISIDLDKLIEQGDISLNIQIVDGDDVYITKAGFFYVTGEVNTPGAFEYSKTDDTTVIKAITLGGGFTERADQDDIEIHRTVEGKKSILKSVAQDLEIQADDVILVPNIFIEDFKGHKANILGQVNSPGNYELRGQTTLLEFISKAGGLTEEAGSSVTIKRQEGDGEDRRIVVDLYALIEKGDISKNVLILNNDSVYINRVGHYYITGEVERPDAYQFKKEDALNMIMAIVLAGGFTGKADQDGIKIYRVIDNKEVVLNNVKVGELVMENDIIVIPESFF